MSRTAPESLTVQVPFAIRKRGGRKQIVVPDGAMAPRLRVDSTLVKTLARAFRWKRMIDSGAFATIGDLAAHEKIASSYLTRVMRLTLLAPEIVEGIVDGRTAPGLAETLQPFRVEWEGRLRLSVYQPQTSPICNLIHIRHLRAMRLIFFTLLPTHTGFRRVSTEQNMPKIAFTG